MADMEKTEFEFPDEVEAKGKPVAKDTEELDIEVIDDTPKQDRGRKPDTSPPEDPTEEELASYDEKVQHRLKKFTRGYHDERRAKEEALREREAAESLAKNLWNENRILQQQVDLGSKAYIEQSQTAAEHAFDSAKKKYKEAYEAGDPDAVVEAQAEVARATLNIDKAQNMRPLQAQEKVIQQPQRANKVPTTDRDNGWMQKNTWFGTDPEMTASALGLHQKLARDQGNDFVGTSEYYKRVDVTMRKRFPEYFDDTGSYEDDAPSQKASEPDEDTSSHRATKPSTVVAPASRSTPPNRIRLKASEVAIARRLGVPLELYAKQVAQLKRGN